MLTEYLNVAALSPDEYMAHLLLGWRRFGHSLFRYHCSGLGACRSLRIDAARFRPDRSQRRTRKANERTVRLRIGTPSVTPEKLALFDRFHADRSETRGWYPSEPDDAAEYAKIFVINPFPTQEWCYYLDDVLVGVGYVDDLVGGLSAIYFAHDPDHRRRSLGTWNVLSLLDRASTLRCPTSTSAISPRAALRCDTRRGSAPISALNPTASGASPARDPSRIPCSAGNRMESFVDTLGSRLRRDVDTSQDRDPKPAPSRPYSPHRRVDPSITERRIARLRAFIHDTENRTIPTGILGEPTDREDRETTARAVVSAAAHHRPGRTRPALERGGRGILDGLGGIARRVSGKSALELDANVSFPTVDGHSQRLDVYTPDTPPPPGGYPVMIAIHGGGWRAFAKGPFGLRNAEAFTQAGYVVVAPNYVLSKPGDPTWPENFEDVQAAVRWVRTNAAARDFDPQEVVAEGESAGANLAALLGVYSPQDRVNGSSSAVDAVVAVSTPTDLTALYQEKALGVPDAAQFLGGSPEQVPANYIAASPIDHVAPATRRCC